MVPLVFHILEETDFRTKSESSSVTHAEVAKIIHWSENFGLWVLDIESGQFEFSRDLEDVHMNIEAELTRRIGPAGAKLHTARSRNDQVALDFRLYLRDASQQIQQHIRSLQKALVGLADRHRNARSTARATRSGVIFAEIAGKPAAYETSEQWSYAFWDSWPMFLLLAGCLCAEWFLRRRYGLV